MNEANYNKKPRPWSWGRVQYTVVCYCT